MTALPAAEEMWKPLRYPPPHVRKELPASPGAEVRTWVHACTTSGGKNVEPALLHVDLRTLG